MRIFGFIWRFLGNLVKIVQILLVLVFLALFAGLFADSEFEIPDSAALVLSPSGMLVDQLEGDPFERALAEAQGAGIPQTLLSDVIDSLYAAADDDRIKAVVLRLDGMAGGGLAKLQSVADALQEVRAAGKPIIAIGNSFTQDQYYLAAYADEIHLHNFGVVYIDGYGYYRTYLKGILEKLKIDLNVFRVGKYKSFVEPFIRNDMSAEDQRASRRWLDAMWTAYKTDVADARSLQPESIDEYANRFVRNLRKAGGNTAQMALDTDLVDFLSTESEFSKKLIEITGPDPDDPDSYSGVNYFRYINQVRAENIVEPGLPEIAVLVAAGEIIDGEASAGTIGGDTLAALVHDAANDAAIKALVLRVDSPGGSMFASEVILEQLLKLKLMGKPLVVSMSSVAASGGYYIAMPADEIWASKTTITGSIGVGALLPTFNRSLEEIGISIDGIGTTSLSGQFRSDRALGDDAREYLQLSIEEAYRVFVNKVASYRGMSFDRADNLAQGRVWIGDDALAIDLIDKFGNLDDAIESAAKLAGLESKDYAVRTIERELSFNEQLAVQFLGKVGVLLREYGLISNQGWQFGLAGKLARNFDNELGWLTRLNDPRGIYFHCFCIFP